MSPYNSPSHKLVRIPIIFFSLSILFFSYPIFAATGDVDQLDWFTMGIELFGGLALFLFGMEQMSEGLKAASGESLKTLLASVTKNRILGAITGAFITAILNSSSVTTVLVVGFITAGIMTMAQSVGIIMGANIGSTFTAQIIAFNITQYALLMVAVGFAMLFISNVEKTRHYGAMIMGLGLVFFGMGVMSEGMVPLRTYEPFIELMVRMEKPLLGILVGAVFTGLVQSSAATTGIAIVMASEGLMSLPAGIALAFGANIGTCVTAILAAIGKPTEAKRAAAVHILFNVIGVMIWVAFIPELARFVEWLSPTSPDLTGTAKLAAEVPRQIANAHTVFNVANTIIFLGFTTQFAKLASRLVPEKVVPVTKIIEPKYLDNELLITPSLALERVQMEIGHLGEITQDMLDKIRPAFLSGKPEELNNVAKLDDKADILHDEIMAYLNKLQKEELTEDQNDSLLRLLRISEDLERVGDIIETDLVDTGHEAMREDIASTETTRHAMKALYEAVKLSLAEAIQGIVKNDELASQQVIHMKKDIKHLVDEALEFQAVRVKLQEPDAMKIVRFEGEVIDALNRIYSLAKRIAKLNIPEPLLQETA